MSAEEGGFLSRWSQRKRRSRDEPERAPGTPQPEAPDRLDVSPDASPGQVPSPETLDDEQVAALPDPETLGIDDDFKPFMRPGVPAALKRRALRRLWAVNPFYNIRDGLDDYDEDYTDAATVVPNLRTLFEPGRGMPQPERWRKPEAAAESLPEPLEGDPEETLSTAEAAGTDEDAVADAAPAADPPALEREPGAAPAEVPSGRSRRGAAQRRWSGFSPIESESPAGAGDEQSDAAAVAGKGPGGAGRGGG